MRRGGKFDTKQERHAWVILPPKIAREFDHYVHTWAVENDLITLSFQSGFRWHGVPSEIPSCVDQMINQSRGFMKLCIQRTPRPKVKLRSQKNLKLRHLMHFSDHETGLISSPAFAMCISWKTVKHLSRGHHVR